MPSLQCVELSDFIKINDEFMHLHYEIHALESENIALRTELKEMKKSEAHSCKNLIRKYNAKGAIITHIDLTKD
jgi:hypothetical protein